MKKLICLLFLISVCTVGWAGVDFDGTDDQIILGTGTISAIMNGVSATTVSMWIKADTMPANDTTKSTFLSYVGTTEAGITMALRDDSGVDQLRCAGRGSGDDTYQEHKTAFSTTGEWTHFICTFDYPNDEINSYINGVAGTPTAVTFTYDTYIDENTQTTEDSIANASSTFDGQITEIAIWGTELNQEEVTQLYGSRLKRIPLQIRPASLIMYWSLDEYADGLSGDGLTFRDIISEETGTGDNGAGNDNLTCKAGEYLSYP